MAGNDTSKAANASSPAANSPESPSQSPPPKESSPPPQGPPPSSSPPPSSPPPSSPPPSSPPPSSPTPSSPPPSSPPPSSPPPSSPPPSSTSPPPSDTSSPPPSPPQDSSSSPPPPDATPSNPSPPATPTTPPSNSSAGIIPPPPSPSSGQFKPPPPVATPKSPVVTLSPPPSVPAGNASSKPGTGSGDLPSSSSHSTSSSLGSASNRDLLIVGVVASSIILIALLGACVVCLISKKKRRKEANDDIPYTWKNNGAASAKGGSYRHNAPAYNNNLKIPPPPGGWGQNQQQQQPNVPPQMIGSSGEMASSYSTGQASSASEPPSPSLQIGFNKSMFTYEELSVATNGFAPSNILGQGGFGLVHKGILPNGKEIAVKSLKAGSGQGEREFQAEVEIISRVHHRHLVSLVGYSIAGAQRMLVYEYVPNNNLEYHLHKRGDPPLDFSTRLRIALGSAKGLAYLHEDCHPRIIHRDIKASNILIDFSFEAKVADFGLAKLTTDANTHVSTRVMGTFGYLAPEYAASGKLTEKSDVFSFGVMLLELITGRRPVDPKMKYMEDSLVDWARPLLSKALEDGNYNEIADPCLERNYNPQEMSRMVASAAACIRHSAKKRPKMSQIVRALEGDVSLDDLNDGVRPGHRSTSSLTAGSSDYDTKQYNADLKRFRQMALETGEFASGGGTTSEYGLNPSSSSDSSRDSSRKF